MIHATFLRLVLKPYSGFKLSNVCHLLIFAVTATPLG
jgi:hypothetical protein